MHEIIWDFEIQMDHPTQKARPNTNWQEKKTVIKWILTIEWRWKSEKQEKYLDLAGELKEPWNMKVTVISIIVMAFKTVSKKLEKKLDQLEIRG